jgi:hypothetical protein
MTTRPFVVGAALPAAGAEVARARVHERPRRSLAGSGGGLWAWTRLLGGAAILGVLVWRLGAGPYVDGVRTINAGALAAAAGIAVVTTVCCAWRWTLVARALGADLRLRTAVSAYYRSQFLNTVLPGGVLGDVHRGVRHGREVHDVGRGLRVVGWERLAGQVVQAALALVVLLTLPSPVGSVMPVVAAALAVGALSAVLLGAARPGDRSSRWARMVGNVGADIRAGLLARRCWPGIVLASLVVVVGHAATFVIAARTAGSAESAVRLLPLGLLALLAMALPMNIGGWGPREGATAWAFGTAGLGVDQGVATAVVYGVMVLVASLPGAVVLVAEGVLRLNRGSDRDAASNRGPAGRASHGAPEGAARG